jgi:hypothetical protein
MAPGQQLAHLIGREVARIIQSAALGGKPEASIDPLEIEGLDPQTVAGQEQLLGVAVVGGKGKHAAKLIEKG